MVDGQVVTAVEAERVPDLADPDDAIRARRTHDALELIGSAPADLLVLGAHLVRQAAPVRGGA